MKLICKILILESIEADYGELVLKYCMDFLNIYLKALDNFYIER